MYSDPDPKMEPIPQHAAVTTTAAEDGYPAILSWVGTTGKT